MENSDIFQSQILKQSLETASAQIVGYKNAFLFLTFNSTSYKIQYLFNLRVWFKTLKVIKIKRKNKYLYKCYVEELSAKIT